MLETSPKTNFFLCKDIESIGFCNDCLLLLLVTVVIDHRDVQMVRLEIETDEIFGAQIFDF